MLEQQADFSPNKTNLRSNNLFITEGFKVPGPHSKFLILQVGGVLIARKCNAEQRKIRLMIRCL